MHLVGPVRQPQRAHVRVIDGQPGVIGDAAAAKRRIDEGFQFIAVASEAGLMLSKAQELMRALGMGAGKGVAKY